MSESAIEVRCQLTVDDLTLFQRFHRLRQFGFLLLPLVFLLVIFAAALIQALRKSQLVQQVLVNLAPLMLCFAAALYFIITGPRRDATRQYNATQSLRELAVLHFSDSGITSEGASSSWSIAWKVVTGVQETKSLFVVYHTGNVGLVIPKRLFSGIDKVDDFRQRLAAWVSPLRVQSGGFAGDWS